MQPVAADGTFSMHIVYAAMHAVSDAHVVVFDAWARQVAAFVVELPTHEHSVAPHMPYAEHVVADAYRLFDVLLTHTAEAALASITAATQTVKARILRLVMLIAGGKR